MARAGTIYLHANIVTRTFVLAGRSDKSTRSIEYRMDGPTKLFLSRDTPEHRVQCNRYCKLQAVNSIQTT